MDNTIVKLYLATRTMRKNNFFVCWICHERILPGEKHRTSLSGMDRTCTKCVGFLLSRYSFTFYIPDPTAEELAAAMESIAILVEKYGLSKDIVYPVVFPLLSTGNKDLDFEFRPGFIN